MTTILPVLTEIWKEYTVYKTSISADRQTNREESVWCVELQAVECVAISSTVKGGVN